MNLHLQAIEEEGAFCDDRQTNATWTDNVMLTWQIEKQQDNSMKDWEKLTDRVFIKKHLYKSISQLRQWLATPQHTHHTQCC